MRSLRRLSDVFATRGDILPQTRITAAAVPPILIAAFLILYVFPGSENGYYDFSGRSSFAWPIAPQITSMLLGATYMSGIFYFSYVFLSRKWQKIGIGFLPVALFTWILLITTIWHWNSFTHNHVTFWLWAGLYFTTPFLLPWLWWRNRKHSVPLEINTTDVVIPSAVRAILFFIGIAVVIMGLLLFTLPGEMEKIWPWAITPLTARVLTAPCALFAGIVLAVAWEPRWDVSRGMVRTQLLLPFVFLGAVVASWNDIDTSRALTWLLLGGAGAFLVFGIQGLYFYMEIKRRQEPIAA